MSIGQSLVCNLIRPFLYLCDLKVKDIKLNMDSWDRIRAKTNELDNMLEVSIFTAHDLGGTDSLL